MAIPTISLVNFEPADQRSLKLRPTTLRSQGRKLLIRSCPPVMHVLNADTTETCGVATRPIIIDRRQCRRTLRHAGWYQPRTSWAVPAGERNISDRPGRDGQVRRFRRYLRDDCTDILTMFRRVIFNAVCRDDRTIESRNGGKVWNGQRCAAHQGIGHASLGQGTRRRAAPSRRG